MSTIIQKLKKKILMAMFLMIPVFKKRRREISTYSGFFEIRINLKIA